MATPEEPLRMTEQEAVEQIHPMIAQLEGLRDRLLALEKSLPEALVEAGAEDLEEVDYGTELRSVLRCVVGDSLRPAIADLLSICSLAPGAAESPAE